MPAFDFVLAGRYRLVAPLGEGGMAAVYRGRDLRLNRDVAIKVLREDLTRDPHFLTRFQREAEMVASLSHPNIVAVYDVGEEGGTHFIVMEYVRGRTLADLLEAESRLMPDRAISIMTPILEALSYAHSRGLVHRDVKPQNVLLAQDGTPKLADFGIAHLTDGSTTRTAAILGSAQYLSPEQSRGEEATPLSDVYAAAIVMWELVAGQPPFHGSNALAIAHHHIHSSVPSLVDRVPEAPSGLVTAVEQALAKDPADRFPSAEAFAEALHDARPSHALTAVQPLVQVNAARPIAPTDVPESHLTYRRSARKSVLLGAFLAALVGVAWYAATMLPARTLPSYPSTPYLAVPLAAAAAFVFSWLTARSRQYILDGRAAAVQWGLLAHHRIAVPLHRINTVQLRQSVIDRIVGVGTIEFLAVDESGTERLLVMDDIPRVRAAYDQLLHLAARTGRHLADG